VPIAVMARATGISRETAEDRFEDWLASLRVSTRELLERPEGR
jgi:hypothetical protein